MTKSVNLKTEYFYGLLLIIVLALAGWLRWQFIQTVNLYPDEFVTLLAMDMIQQKGAPILPSGLFYEHGLLYSYLAAGMALLGEAVFWGRFVSLILGLASIGLSYFVGRRWFSPLAGIMAGLGLALTPVAIQWSGRVRMYALLQFLVLLVITLTLESVFRQKRWAGWAAIIAYLGALLSQFVAIALLPPLVLAELLARYWQYRQTKKGLIRFLRNLGIDFWSRMLALGGVAIIAFLVKRAGQPKGIAPLAEANPVSGIWQVVQIYGQLSLDIGQSWQAISPFFLEPPVLIFSLFSLVAIASLFFAAKSERAVTGFVSLIVLVSTVEMLFLVAPDRRDDKYMFMLLPLLLLLGGQGMALVVKALKLNKKFWLEAITVILLCLGLGWYAIEPIKALLSDVGEDYESAFNYIAQNWHPGEAILSGTPTAAYHYLGRNDYYAVEAGGPYDYRILPGPNGRPVERWLASPWINTAEDLNALFAQQTVWLALERWGLLVQYYSPLFMQNILAQTDFIREDNGVIVLKSRPNPRLLAKEPEVSTDTLLIGAEGDSGQLKLLGYSLQDNRLTLYWQAQTPLTFNYTVFVNVQTPAGETVQQSDHLPLGSIYPTTLWPAGEIIRETSPLNLPPGSYHLRAGMYRLETGERMWVPDDTSLQNMADLGQIIIPEK